MTRHFHPTRPVRALLAAATGLALLIGAAAPATARDGDRDERSRRQGAVARHGDHDEGPIRMARHGERRRDARRHDHERHRRGDHDVWHTPSVRRVPAFDRRGYDHAHRGHDYGRHRGHGHGRGHVDRGHGHGHHRHHAHGPRHPVARPGWFCRPCGHRFASAHRLHWHLHHDHHVPWHVIPRVLVRIDLGWIFHG